MNEASEVEAGEVIGAGTIVKQFDPEVAKRVKAEHKEKRRRERAQAKERVAATKLLAQTLKVIGH